MAESESRSLTQRLGGNRTLVLVVVIGLLVVFTVASDILPALGVTRDSTALEYEVHGRRGSLRRSEFEAQFRSWQAFHRGRILTNMAPDARPDLDRLDQKTFVRDLLLAELARDAGVVIPDATLREWLVSRDEFKANDGKFDLEVFRTVLESGYNGMSVRAFQEEARRFLAADHYIKFYSNSLFLVGDDEAYARWKSDHPKVKVRYAWQPVSPLRADLKEESVTTEELEKLWKESNFQERHRIPARWGVDAVTVAGHDVSMAAVDAALAEWKDDKGLSVDEDAAYGHWFQLRNLDYDLAAQDEATRAALRALNVAHPGPDAKPGELETPAKAGDGAAAPGDPADPAPPPPPADGGDAEGTPHRFYRWWWRAYVVRELLLKKVVQRVLDEARDTGISLEEAARKWSRPGMELRFVSMPKPLPQEEIGNDPLLGGNTRFAVNQYGTQDVGKLHKDVVDRTLISQDLKARGFVAFRLNAMVPSEIPPMELVRDAVVREVLDRRAKDLARRRLEDLRKVVEDGSKDFAAAAAEAGLETEEAGPFHEWSWRPPAPLPKPGATRDPDAWKIRDRRQGFVIGRYLVTREVPPGRFAPTLADTDGDTATGAFYLIRVEGRVDPAPGEMTVSQKALAIRSVRGERFERVARELEFEGLCERLRATFEGKPLPAAWDRKPGDEQGDEAR